MNVERRRTQTRNDNFSALCNFIPLIVTLEMLFANLNHFPEKLPPISKNKFCGTRLALVTTVNRTTNLHIYRFTSYCCFFILKVAG